MRKSVIHAAIAVLFFFLSSVGNAKNVWPKEIPINNGGKITIYQPQPESLVSNLLKSRSAISIKKNATAEPIFGVIWTESVLETDRNSRMATLESIKVTDAKFPDGTNESQVDSLKKLLEKEFLKWNLEVSLDEIASTLEENKKAGDDKLNTAPPEIIYTDKPSTLVMYDGEPIVKKDEKMNLERAINTPSLIVKSPEDSKYYMYGEKIWYNSASLKDNWTQTKSLPVSIKSINEQIVKQEKESKDTAKAPNPAPVIVVATKPTELIQTNGEPKFASIENTGLLYANNSDNDIFMDVTGQQYYVVLSGRWYKSASLKGPWAFVAADQLPADFAKIPEGSEKDGVLANVAGTDASREAIMDAQIPQTAKVDRKTAKCEVTYDGEPKFETIEGTNMEVAKNTSTTVIKSDNKYYAVQDGIWFMATVATGGLWAVCTERPSEVDKIPPTSPAYNTKYVYIYDSSPEVVYVGYTPGYVGCYVYGPTVVYGTGYYYQPWYGAYYYPRPVTYGYAFHYNPYTGWGMVVGVNYGMVSVHFGGYHGGWYGPPYYRPPYYHPYYGHYPPHYHGSYYGHHSTNVNVNVNKNVNINNNNIYHNKQGATTRDNKMAPSTRPSTGGNQGGSRPSTQPSTKPGAGGSKPSTMPANNNMAKPATKTPNNVYSDKQGNVYKQNDKGNWDQRDKGNWKSTSPSSNANVNQMQKESQNRDRSNTRQNNYQNNSRPQQSSPSGGNRGGGGASRPSHSGGGRR